METTPHYPFPTPDASGLIREVVPGIWWIRFPLPYALNHINVWLLRDNDGWVVIDTGVALPETQALWREVLKSIGKISRVIATHFHPDHVGNAGWLCKEFSAELWMSQSEWLLSRLLWIDQSPETYNNNTAFFRKCALPEKLVEHYAKRGDSYRTNVSAVPRHYNRIKHGDQIEIDGINWEVVVGFGHSVEHVCLYSATKKILLGSDQVLPRISPVIGVHPMEPEDDPLGDYLSSLGRFTNMAPETLVLPGHELPFTGLVARVDALRAHHANRLQAIIDHSIKPFSVFDGLNFVFGHNNFKEESMRLAIAETLAHLNYLVHRKKLVRRLENTGIWMFSAT